MQLNAGKFRLIMNFPSLSPKRKQTSCQGEAIVCFHSLFDSWQTPYRYKTADDFLSYFVVKKYLLVGASSMLWTGQWISQ